MDENSTGIANSQSAALIGRSKVSFSNDYLTLMRRKDADLKKRHLDRSMVFVLPAHAEVWGQHENDFYRTLKQDMRRLGLLHRNFALQSQAALSEEPDQEDLNHKILDLVQKNTDSYKSKRPKSKFKIKSRLPPPLVELPTTKPIRPAFMRLALEACFREYVSEHASDLPVPQPAEEEEGLLAQKKQSSPDLKKRKRQRDIKPVPPVPELRMAGDKKAETKYVSKWMIMIHQFFVFPGGLFGEPGQKPPSNPKSQRELSDPDGFGLSSLGYHSSWEYADTRYEEEFLEYKKQLR